MCRGSRHRPTARRRPRTRLGRRGRAAGTGQITAGQQNASTTPEPTPPGTFRLGGVTVSLGGFIEARRHLPVAQRGRRCRLQLQHRHPAARNRALYHENEFRGSARQSRLSLLIQGDVDPHQKLAAYFETDFQGSAPTANSVESNSYNLRLRQAYGTYDNTDWGFHFLGGQAWSLLTPQKVGITPRQEDIPLTIDAQYVVGFNWTRQPQARFVGDFFDHKLWAGLSLESPQAVFFTGPNGTGVARRHGEREQPRRLRLLLGHQLQRRHRARHHRQGRLGPGLRPLRGLRPDALPARPGQRRRRRAPTTPSSPAAAAWRR